MPPDRQRESSVRSRRRRWRLCQRSVEPRYELIEICIEDSNLARTPQFALGGVDIVGDRIRSFLLHAASAQPVKQYSEIPVAQSVAKKQQCSRLHHRDEVSR